MTEQGLAILTEMRDKVVAQGEPAVMFGQCRYSDHKGNKCAIGQLIANDRYSPDLEGYVNVEVGILNEALRDDVREAIKADPLLPMAIKDMQRAHDFAYNDSPQEEFVEDFFWRANNVIDAYEKAKLA